MEDVGYYSTGPNLIYSSKKISFTLEYIDIFEYYLQ